jgi:hypothetical protein
MFFRRHSNHSGFTACCLNRRRLCKDLKKVPTSNEQSKPRLTKQSLENEVHLTQVEKYGCPTILLICPQLDGAQMLELDQLGMRVQVKQGGSSFALRVPFTRPAKDRG